MFGAVKPPWIKTKDFNKSPYNYCDRWCERCQFTSFCKVFKQEELSRERAIKLGINPDSWEYVAETVAKQFAVVKDLLAKDLERLGIDPNELEEVPEPKPDPQRQQLANLVSDYSSKLHELLKSLEFIPAESDIDLVTNQVEVISFYSTLITAKVKRASFDGDLSDEHNVEDSMTSAYIAVRGLLAISQALIKLFKHKPLNTMRQQLHRLCKQGVELAQLIDDVFELKQFGSDY